MRSSIEQSYRDRHCIIIGAMKCGTTALFHFLSRNYSSILASQKKDTKFFVDSTLGGNWEKGLSWYIGMFPEGAGIKLEASTHYTKYPHYQGCPARIRQLLKNVRLVYLVRDPLRRAISHFFHNLFVDRDELDINIALGGVKNKYIFYSDYALQLAQYYEHFDKGDIAIINAIEPEDKRQSLQYLENLLELPYVADRSIFEPANTTKDNAIESGHSMTAGNWSFPEDNVRAALEFGLTQDNLAKTIDLCTDNAVRFGALTDFSVEHWIQDYQKYLPSPCPNQGK